MKLLWNEKNEEIVWEDGSTINYDDFALAREIVRRYNVHEGLVSVLDEAVNLVSEENGWGRQ